jgi:hypothetical protein
MARKKAPAPEAGPEAAPAPEAAQRRQVNLDDDLYRRGGIIAAHLGISLPDYVNSRLRVIIDGDMPAVLEALNMDTRQK